MTHLINIDGNNRTSIPRRSKPLPVSKPYRFDLNFELFGFDILFSENCYGFWFGGIKDHNSLHRHLFGVYFQDRELMVDFCFIHVVG